MTSSGLHVDSVTKAFGAKKALDGVSCSVQPSEVAAILGPSGCGKSTLLNIIAGLDTPDQGSIAWDGSDLANVPAHKRGFGLMFQDYALFPHLNVFDNIAFGLRQGDHTSVKDIHLRVGEMVKLVGLEGYAQRDTLTLSGGEQQRVALARSLAPQPRLLMLDEPLAALDRQLRERLAQDLHHILRKIHQTAIYVTHDQEEAFSIADRVIILNAGRVEQVDTPQAIYQRPASPFVARFLGFDNLVSGEGRGATAETALGPLPLPHPAQGSLLLLLHPQRLHLGQQGSCRLEGTVIETAYRGAIYRITLQVKGQLLSLDVPGAANLPVPGDKIVLSFDPAEAIQVFQL